MSPARVEEVSDPANNFFCYKNLVYGVVLVKVNNFESIMKSNHNYPLKKLRLILRVNGSSLFLEDDKSNSKKELKFEHLEHV